MTACRTLCAVALVVTVAVSAACGSSDDGVARTSVADDTATTFAPPEAEVADMLEVDDPVIGPEGSADDRPLAIRAAAAAGVVVDPEMASVATDLDTQTFELVEQFIASSRPQGVRRSERSFVEQSDAGGPSPMATLGRVLSQLGLLRSQGTDPISKELSATSSKNGWTGSATVGLTIGSGTGGFSNEEEIVNDDGRVARSKVSGKVSGGVCPDEAGVLEFRVEGRIEVEANDGTMTIRGRNEFTADVSVRFDDSAEAADIQIDLNVQSDRTDPGGRNAFVDVSQSVTVAGLYGASPTQNFGEMNVNRASQSVSSAPRADDVEMFTAGRQAALDVVMGALSSRRGNVRGGGCVGVVTTAPESVAPGAEVTIDVATRHVLDGVDLDKPVDATLSGEASITPTTLDSTPGTITHTAGTQPGSSATIDLVSTSRRGIGQASVTIGVSNRFRVDAPAGALLIQGGVCSFDAPVRMTVTGEINGELIFTPTGPDGGTYAGSGTVGPGSIVWSGTYTVTGAGTATPSMFMNDGTTTLSGPVSIAVPSFWEGGNDLPLVPDPNVPCT